MDLEDALTIINEHWDNPIYPYNYSGFKLTSEEAFKELSQKQKDVVNRLMRLLIK